MMKERAGPTSLLPTAENQVVVYDYIGQKEYGLWVDATSSKTSPKLINCTIFPFPVNVTKEQFRYSFLGALPTKSSKEQDVPCGYSGKTCEIWGYVNTFSSGCEGHAYLGQEPMRGTFEPAPSSAGGGDQLLRRFTNDIFLNTSMPKECIIGDSGTRWYHQDYMQDWAPAPSSDVFQVPPDSQCAQGKAPRDYSSSPPWLTAARGVLPHRRK